MGIRMRNKLYELMTEYERANQKRIALAEWARTFKISVNTLKAWMYQDTQRYDTNIVERMANFFGLDSVEDFFYFEREPEA